MTDADLVYAGRERKRPPGASDFVQRIYGLLHEHPQGMTRDELWEALRDGWLETDAYRAYDHYLVTHRAVYHQTPPSDRPDLLAKGSGQYGTDDFKRRAQRWWISEALSGMVYRGSARRDSSSGESRWFAGRPPLVAVERKRGGREPLDVARQRAASQAATQTHVRREQIKARFLADLNDPKLKTATRKNVEHLRETIRLGFEYLSGR